MFAEQRVDLRSPTLADRESVTVIVEMLLIAKGTPWNHRPRQLEDRLKGPERRETTANHGKGALTTGRVVPQIEILQDFAQNFP